MILVDVVMLKRTSAAEPEPVFFIARPGGEFGYLAGKGFAGLWPHRALEQLVRHERTATA